MSNRSREQSDNELSRLPSVPRLRSPATLGKFRLPARSGVVRKTRSSGEYLMDYRAARALPIFGPHLEDFVQWLGAQGYTPGSIRCYLRLLPQVVRWLRR